MNTLLDDVETTRDNIRTIGRPRSCNTIDCKAPATSIIGHTSATGTKWVDAVCGECRGSYCRRPALRVKVALVL